MAVALLIDACAVGVAGLVAAGIIFLTFARF
jgi:hypothetical protein